MTPRIFTSYNDLFSFTLPENWSEYDDGDDETYAFFNTGKWSGNLRITPIIWSGVKEGVDKAYNHIVSELNNNSGATLVQLAGYDTAHYKKTVRTKQ